MRSRLETDRQWAEKEKCSVATLNARANYTTISCANIRISPNREAIVAALSAIRLFAQSSTRAWDGHSRDENVRHKWSIPGGVYDDELNRERDAFSSRQSAAYRALSQLAVEFPGETQEDREFICHSGIFSDLFRIWKVSEKCCLLTKQSMECSATSPHVFQNEIGKAHLCLNISRLLQRLGRSVIGHVTLNLQQPANRPQANGSLGTTEETLPGGVAEAQLDCEKILHPLQKEEPDHGKLDENRISSPLFYFNSAEETENFRGLFCDLADYFLLEKESLVLPRSKQTAESVLKRQVLKSILQTFQTFIQKNIMFPQILMSNAAFFEALRIIFFSILLKSSKNSGGSSSCESCSKSSDILPEGVWEACAHVVIGIASIATPENVPVLHAITNFFDFSHLSLSSADTASPNPMIPQTSSKPFHTIFPILFQTIFLHNASSEEEQKGYTDEAGGSPEREHNREREKEERMLIAVLLVEDLVKNKTSLFFFPNLSERTEILRALFACIYLDSALIYTHAIVAIDHILTAENEAAGEKKQHSFTTDTEEVINVIQIDIADQARQPTEDGIRKVSSVNEGEQQGFLAQGQERMETANADGATNLAEVKYQETELSPHDNETELAKRKDELFHDGNLEQILSIAVHSHSYNCKIHTMHLLGILCDRVASSAFILPLSLHVILYFLMSRGREKSMQRYRAAGSRKQRDERTLMSFLRLRTSAVKTLDMLASFATTHEQMLDARIEKSTRNISRTIEATGKQGDEHSEVRHGHGPSGERRLTVWKGALTKAMTHQQLLSHTAGAQRTLRLLHQLHQKQAAQVYPSLHPDSPSSNKQEGAQSNQSLGIQPVVTRDGQQVSLHQGDGLDKLPEAMPSVTPSEKRIFSVSALEAFFSKPLFSKNKSLPLSKGVSFRSTAMSTASNLQFPAKTPSRPTSPQAILKQPPNDDRTIDVGEAHRNKNSQEGVPKPSSVNTHVGKLLDKSNEFMEQEGLDSSMGKLAEEEELATLGSLSVAEDWTPPVMEHFEETDEEEIGSGRSDGESNDGNGDSRFIFQGQEPHKKKDKKQRKKERGTENEKEENLSSSSSDSSLLKNNRIVRPQTGLSASSRSSGLIQELLSLLTLEYPAPRLYAVSVLAKLCCPPRRPAVRDAKTQDSQPASPTSASPSSSRPPTPSRFLFRPLTPTRKSSSSTPPPLANSSDKQEQKQTDTTQRLAISMVVESGGILPLVQLENSQPSLYDEAERRLATSVLAEIETFDMSYFRDLIHFAEIAGDNVKLYKRLMRDQKFIKAKREREEEEERRRRLLRQFTSDDLARFREMFKMIDRDGSGSVDAAELFQLFNELGYPQTMAEVEQLVKDADVDGNGTISFDEFLLLMAKVVNDDKMQGAWKILSKLSLMQIFQLMKRRLMATAASVGKMLSFSPSADISPDDLDKAEHIAEGQDGKERPSSRESDKADDDVDIEVNTRREVEMKTKRLAELREIKRRSSTVVQKRKSTIIRRRDIRIEAEQAATMTKIDAEMTVLEAEITALIRKLPRPDSESEEGEEELNENGVLHANTGNNSDSEDEEESS